MSAMAQRAPQSLLRVWERHGRSLPSVAEVVLAILLAVAAAELLWKLVPAPEAAAWRPPSVVPASVPAGRNHGPNVDLIVNAHLFGQYQAPADPVLTELSEAPDTRLDLTLLGILAATAEKGSRALIASSAGDEAPYSIGSDVVRGVSLQAIFPDRVILSRNGQLETLRLDKDAPAKPLSADSYQDEDEDVMEEESENDTGSMLSNIREEVMSDPSRASNYIRVQPASNGGQLRGYRVYPGRDRTVFTAVGLRPGDLVTQVNGIQLNDANTALQMLGQLSNSNSLTVVVERGGQQQTVNVNLN